MSTIQTAKTDFATIAATPGLWPVVGSYIYGFDIADNIFKKIDEAGIITVVGGDTLAEVLANSPSTGNQSITSIDSNTFLELSNNFGQITSSNGVGITGQVFLDALNIIAGVNISDGVFTGAITIEPTLLTIDWNNGIGNIGTITSSAADMLIQHTDRVAVVAPIIDLQVGLNGVSVTSLSLAFGHDTNISSIVTSGALQSKTLQTTASWIASYHDGGFTDPAAIIQLDTTRTYINHKTQITLASPIYEWTSDNAGYTQGWIYGDTTTAWIGFGAESEVKVTSTEALLSFSSLGLGGSVSINSAELNIAHTTLIELACANIDVSALPTGPGTVAIGELFVDTEANITAGGHLLVARRVV